MHSLQEHGTDEDEDVMVELQERTEDEGNSEGSAESQPQGGSGNFGLRDLGKGGRSLCNVNLHLFRVHLQVSHVNLHSCRVHLHVAHVHQGLALCFNIIFFCQLFLFSLFLKGPEVQE